MDSEGSFKQTAYLAPHRARTKHTQAMYLAPEQARSIEQRIAAIEARTGVQVVVALIGRCDAYPEIRWKAFALGVALAALAVVGADVARVAWTPQPIAAIVAILAVGATSALLAQLAPWYGRLFVRHNRAEAETRDYAEAMFLERGLFATEARSTVLVLAGLFERAVVVHPDTGIAKRVDERDWQRVVEAITPLLARGERAAALEAGLQALAGVLERVRSPLPAGAGNVVPDRPIQERGE